MDNRGFDPAELESDYSIPRVSLKHKPPNGGGDYALSTIPNGNQYYQNPSSPDKLGAVTFIPPPTTKDGDPNMDHRRASTIASHLDHDASFEDLEWEPNSPLAKFISTIQSSISNFIIKSRGGIKTALLFVLFALYNIYFTGTMVHKVRYELEMEWCDGHGFLIVMTVIVYWSLFYYLILKRFAGRFIYKNVLKPIGIFWDGLWKQFVFRLIFIGVIFAGLLTFLILDTRHNRRRLISAVGIPIILLIALILSKHPARVVWRHILWGTALQFLFGLAILRWELGKDSLQCVSSKVESFLGFSNEGSHFVFNFVGSGFTHNEFTVGATFAFGILSVIFYFSFVVALLYHIGAMTWIVKKIGWLLQITVGTTAAESMNAAANIFLGQTEAPLVIKPFLNDMTNSELNAVMTGGFATIAGTVMGAFISIGVSASHLLSASFMSAPAALALAKLMHPETKVSRTTSKNIQNLVGVKSKKSNFLDAASDGASQAVYLVANIIASLVAVIAFVALLDAVLAWFGGLIGFTDFSFQWILTKLFYPFAFIIGIDTEELEDVSYLLGLKTVVNEFVAYEELTRKCLSPRSKAIATYALCCFANFSSIGIQLGGLGAIAPKRRQDLAKTIWRAFIAGNFAALMTACIAGALTDEMGYNDWINSNMATCLNGTSTSTSLVRNLRFIT